ncbi:lantibiotic dehydratase [Nocardiopsis sp. TSRI0078]|uniref:lantibiotic dehydratase n=1 Tax=unclassified Nocardiopsis TaxID=2649073 RepID=UPI00093D808C|nr:lantibiotic dehydratase [Nocardiopsis sp. TSRI0078]OKI13605.1 lantibiotic dehydratase [Nocardiopsis sp. TSRI0078]
MSLPEFDCVEGPYLVSRVNLYPYLPLRGAAVDADRELVRALAEEEEHRERIRRRLLDALHDAAPEIGDEEHRRAALAAKRDVYNRRPPRASLAGHPVTRRIGALGEWVRSWERTRAAAEELDAAHGPALADERGVLAAWARDPLTDRSTAMSSPDLHRAVAARAAADGPPDKRMRKAEPSLVRYHSRSTVKVSPYSLYTGVHFDDVEQPSSAARDGEPLRFTTEADLRRLLARQAGRVLAADPEARLGMEWVFTGGARREGDRLLVRRRRWVPPAPGLRAEAFGEEEVRVPLSGAWKHLVAVLERRAARPVLLSGLRDGLAADLGQEPSAALAVLDKLIGAGVLVPWAPAAEQSPDFVRHWHELARSLPGAAAARVAAAFEATRDVLGGFGEATGKERARSVLHLQRLWSAAVDPAASADPDGHGDGSGAGTREASGDTASSPLVEDCHVSRGAPVPREWTRTWSDDLRGLMPLLFALDDQRVLAGALESVFVDRYGRGGRCTDLDEFAGHARAAFPMTQRLMAGRTEDADEDLSRLLAARRRAVGHLNDLARQDAEEVEVDPAVVDEVAALLPEREFTARRSFAVFGQPDRGRLVLNHLYGGRARYFSRFLSALPDGVRDRVAAHVRRLGPPDADTVHMRSALGFNANLSPLLAPEELALRDEPVLADGPSTGELHLVHTPRGLRLVRGSREIDPVYTGFLVPHALPYDEMLVAMLADSPFFSFSDTVIDLHERWEEGRADRRTPVGAPRISFGDVLLFRRRWALDADLLAARPGEGPEELHRRVNVERTLRGMPDQVFVRPLQGSRMGPMERAMAPKPQHVDFLSRLHTATAAKRLAHLGPTLFAEELLPCPSEGGLSGPRGRHATEVFLELSTVPSPVPPMPVPPGEVRLVP